MSSPLNQWTNATTPIAPTGNIILDSLLCDYKAGGAVGTAAVLTYSFPWTTSGTAVWATNPSYSPLNEPTSGSGLSPAQQAAVRSTLATWSQVANVQFVEVPETPDSVGDIRIAWTQLSNQLLDAWTWQSPDFHASASDIWLSSPRMGGRPDSDWQPGGFIKVTLIHELGHVLGLSHPFEGDVVLPTAYNSGQYTVMSYTAHPHSLFVSSPAGAIPVYPSTPMLLDVAAIQHLYGANMTWHTGNDIYSFDPAKPFIATLWDAGGNDTISVSNFGTNCLIDLREGHFSSLAILPNAPLTPLPSNAYDGTDNLAIAWNAVIENATGGRGNDVLIGNSSANRMIGNAGNDRIVGGEGLDTAVYSGNHDSYTITGASSEYSVRGPDGNDTLSGIERLQFADAMIAFDIDSHAGQTYRLYQAAFDRAPDQGGLGDWIFGMDQGMSLLEVSAGFMNSPEFEALYGKNPTTCDLVTRLYQNVLHRAPEQGGYDYWVNQIDGHYQSPTQVLTGFSESPENQVQVIGTIQNGIEFTMHQG